MAKTEEALTYSEIVWRNDLARYLANQNHTGRHMWRWVRSPVDRKGVVVACFKCGKLKIPDPEKK